MDWIGLDSLDSLKNTFLAFKTYHLQKRLIF